MAYHKSLIIRFEDSLLQFSILSQIRSTVPFMSPLNKIFIMNSQLAIIALVVLLFCFDQLFWLVPVYSVCAELYCFLVLDRPKPKKSQTGSQKPNNLKLTWQELRKHNTADSAYIAIKNKIYDVTDFLGTHPGGKEFLLLNAGRDATLSFQSYHTFNDLPEKMLQKFLVGELITFEQPQFKEDSGFYRECCERIKLYFKENGLNPKGPIPGLCRAIPLWTLMAYTYYVACYDSSQTGKAKLVAAITFGVCQALNTLHLMHDASHSAVGNSERWWWGFGRLTLDYISGSSMLAWHNQHVMGHHIYTNVMGSDPDVPQKHEGDPRRLCPQQIWKKIYEWQHYYMPVLYGLLSLRSRYYDVFEIFLLETNGPVKVNPISLQDKLRQASSKLLWMFWRYYLPVRVFGMSACEFWTLFLVIEFVTGYWLAVNFQVSHVSDQAEFFYNKVDKLEKNGTNEQWPIEWAVLQVKSSVDYSHENIWMTYACGALNYQVVHHLFPGVSQYHYPAIAPIIQEVCRKYKLNYVSLGSFREAWEAHINYLKKMGKEQKLVGLKLE